MAPNPPTPPASARVGGTDAKVAWLKGLTREQMDAFQRSLGDGPDNTSTQQWVDAIGQLGQNQESGVRSASIASGITGSANGQLAQIDQQLAGSNLSTNDRKALHAQRASIVSTASTQVNALPNVPGGALADLNKNAAANPLDDPTSAVTLANPTVQAGQPATDDQFLGGGTVDDQYKAFQERAVHDPTFLAQVQQMMVYAGLYGQGAPQYGILGDHDRTAMIAFLANSARNGQAPMDALQQSAAYGRTNGVASARAAYQAAQAKNIYEVQHYDPNEISQLAQSVAQGEIGKNLSPTERAMIFKALDSAHAGDQQRVNSAREGASTAANRAQYDAAIKQFTNSPVFDAHPAGLSVQTFHNQDGSVNDMQAANMGGGPPIPGLGWLPGVTPPQSGSLAPTQGPTVYSSDGSAPATPDTSIPAGPGSQTINTTQWNPSADIAAIVRKDHPLEAGAHDMGKTVNMFLNILKGI